MSSLLEDDKVSYLLPVVLYRINLNWRENTVLPINRKLD